MTLLRLGPEEVKKVIDSYEIQVNAIKKNALQLSWYMRGGVSYEDVLNMSVQERTAINEIIEQNLDTTKKSQMPFF